MAAVLFYGDSLLHLVGSLFHILIEVLELALEHFLEFAFGVTGHQAQMLTAWIGLSVFLALGVILIRRIRRVVRKHAVDWLPAIRRVGAGPRWSRLRQTWPGIMACGMGVAALYVFLF